MICYATQYTVESPERVHFFLDSACPILKSTNSLKAVQDAIRFSHWQEEKYSPIASHSVQLARKNSTPFESKTFKLIPGEQKTSNESTSTV
jgi:hypothetical protein